MVNYFMKNDYTFCIYLPGYIFILQKYKLCFLFYSDSVEMPTIDTDVMRFKFENISTSTTSEELRYTPSSDLCPLPSEHEEVNWKMVGKGIALSMGQGIAR